MERKVRAGGRGQTNYLFGPNLNDLLQHYKSWRSLIRDVPLDILDVGRLELRVRHDFF